MIVNKTLQIVLLTLCFSTIGLSQVPSAQKLDPNMALKEADSDGIVWFDPREEPFGLTGMEWIKEDGEIGRAHV